MKISMPFSPSEREEKFNTWAKALGETEQQKCENAERMVKDAIGADPALARLDISVFAQGSYPANTNVRIESDVDVAVRYNPAFIYELPLGRTATEFGIVPATFTQEEFKGLVERALVTKFGRLGVARGNKAFDVHENTYRVAADVVPSFEHRVYTGRFVGGVPEFHSGISIKSDDGKLIVNWPHHSLANGKAKHDSSGRRYKAVVRILKKLKYVMAEDGFPTMGKLPSFLIQSLVWNAPDSVFSGTTYSENVEQVLLHAYGLLQQESSRANMTEENAMKGLFLPTQPWTHEQASSFISIAWSYCGFAN